MKEFEGLFTALLGQLILPWPVVLVISLLVLTVAVLTLILKAVELVQKIVTLSTSADMKPFYQGVTRVWLALVSFLKRLFGYPKLPEGRVKWRPINFRQAVKALPNISGSLLFMCIFASITMLYGWYGPGNPKLSFSAHVTVGTYLVAIVAFARMLMVRGVKIWHGLL